jgi:hypothetical protein
MRDEAFMKKGSQGLSILHKAHLTQRTVLVYPLVEKSF